jgi:hypothetical protein
VQIPIVVYRVRLGARDVKVIRPAGARLRATLRFSGSDYTMFASSGAALRVAAFWEIAARSRNTLVHLPVRGDGTAPPCWREVFTASGSGVDLLLAPRALQFPGHAWKGLRARLGMGAAASFSLPSTVLDPAAEHAPARIWDRESTHRLDLALHAQTLVVSGDPVALRYGKGLLTHVGQASMREDEKDRFGYTGNEIDESDPVLRRHDAGIYLYIPRVQRWS